MSRDSDYASSFIRLTGLLSFMLSDEMTTGSMTSNDAHKRAFATRSHAWNLTNQRFKDAFPEVSVIDVIDHVFGSISPRDEVVPGANLLCFSAVLHTVSKRPS